MKVSGSSIATTLSILLCGTALGLVIYIGLRHLDPAITPTSKPAATSVACSIAKFEAVPPANAELVPIAPVCVLQCPSVHVSVPCVWYGLQVTVSYFQ